MLLLLHADPYISASIKVLSISLDFNKFQKTHKAQTYNIGSFGHDTDYGFKSCLKKECSYWCMVMHSSLKIYKDEMDKLYIKQVAAYHNA